MKSSSILILLFALVSRHYAAQTNGQWQRAQMPDELRYKLMANNNNNNNNVNDNYNYPGALNGQDNYQGGSFMDSSQSSCPAIELADCSGMEIHLRVDNSAGNPPFRGINLANKSGLKINQVISTSSNCPVPRVNMRNTSGTKIFVTDSNNNNSQQYGMSAYSQQQQSPSNSYASCPQISYRDCSGLDLSIRVNNRECPVPQTWDSSVDPNADIRMKDCSGIKIFMRVNGSN